MIILNVGLYSSFLTLEKAGFYFVSCCFQDFLIQKNKQQRDCFVNCGFKHQERSAIRKLGKFDCLPLHDN